MVFLTLGNSDAELIIHALLSIAAITQNLKILTYFDKNFNQYTSQNYHVLFIISLN